MVIYNVGSVREEPIKGNIWLFDSLIHLVLEVGNTTTVSNTNTEARSTF